MGYKEIYNEWLTNAYFDADTKAELERIASDENEIKERFYTDLEFGTAGLRGIIGAGTNRMNIYTVRKATQGLANYILKSGNAEKGVASHLTHAGCHRNLHRKRHAAWLRTESKPMYSILFVRHRSFLMQSENSDVLPESTLQPAIIHRSTMVIRYTEDGAQITPPHDKGIMDEVKAVTDYTTMKTMPAEDAKAAGLYEVIGAEVMMLHSRAEKAGDPSGCH